mgnify:CR=1 FL=1
MYKLLGGVDGGLFVEKEKAAKADNRLIMKFG